MHYVLDSIVPTGTNISTLKEKHAEIQYLLLKTKGGQFYCFNKPCVKKCLDTFVNLYYIILSLINDACPV